MQVSLFVAAQQEQLRLLIEDFELAGEFEDAERVVEQAERLFPSKDWRLLADRGLGFGLR